MKGGEALGVALLLLVVLLLLLLRVAGAQPRSPCGPRYQPHPLNSLMRRLRRWCTSCSRCWWQSTGSRGSWGVLCVCVCERGEGRAPRRQQQAGTSVRHCRLAQIAATFVGQAVASHQLQYMAHNDVSQWGDEKKFQTGGNITASKRWSGGSEARLKKRE